jgi:hypothetical protein
MSSTDSSHEEIEMNTPNMVNDRSQMSDDERNAEQTMPTRGEPANIPVTGENASTFNWIRGEEINDLKTRWRDIQAKFVDEPRASVEQADALVADTLVRLEKSFSSHRANLADNQDVSTEELRVALQSYRSFLNRLLTL